MERRFRALCGNTRILRTRSAASRAKSPFRGGGGDGCTNGHAMRGGLTPLLPRRMRSVTLMSYDVKAPAHGDIDAGRLPAGATWNVTANTSPASSNTRNVHGPGTNS